MKKVAIIGANRFLGFHLTKIFLEQGAEVYGYVHDGHPEEGIVRKEMSFMYGRNANFTEVTDLSRIFVDQNIEAVYFTYIDGGDLYRRSFLRGKIVEAYDALKQTISFCKRQHIPLIFPSSLEVFGDHQQTVKKSTLPEPTTAAGKLYYEFEKKLQYHCNQSRCYIVRCATLYGPLQPMSMVFQQSFFGNQISKISEDKRDLLYVEDVALELSDERKLNKLAPLSHFISGQKRQWQKAASLAGVKGDKNGPHISCQQCHHIAYTRVEEGIEKQRKSTELLFLEK
ncbi:NAD-dependent epimerase/dehydratase family protein [Priestia endophytica]|uniref:NAD-dependent epimerase/dehydratase family protein n=1 Tax=Priestia endophytica TaxID=135735 RepID=UPI002E1B427D|nr:NAD(P)-dependent oxidoreductase [Priestia endophytica]